MVENGNVVSDENLLGGVARYSCDETYVLDGPEERTCQDNGMWSGDEPMCTREWE